MGFKKLACPAAHAIVRAVAESFDGLLRMAAVMRDVRRCQDRFYSGSMW